MDDVKRSSSDDLSAIIKWRRWKNWQQPISITAAQGLSLLFFTAVIFMMIGSIVQNFLDGIMKK